MATVVSPPSVVRSKAQPFSAKQVSDLVRDLDGHRPWIYWLDLTAAIVIGNLAFALFCGSSEPLVFVPAFFLAGLAFYRASMFIHEIQHLREGTFTAFKIYWDLFCGIPFLVPSHTYADHRGHHVNHEYGTADDAEYLRLALEPLRSIVYMVTRVFWIPIVFALRYMLLTPAAWLGTAVRHWTWRHATRVSAINLHRRRPLPDPHEERIWLLQEAGCFAYCWGMIGAMASGLLPWTWLLHVYALSIFIISLSHIRTISSHRFRSTGNKMSYLDQLLDSTTIPGRPLLTELWCPIGMRYHALHHLVPTLPYHNMGRAHRRLMLHLPASSPYRLTIRGGLFSALADIYRSTCEFRRRANRHRHGSFAASASA